MSKIHASENKPQNPSANTVKAAVNVWNRSIARVDAHSRVCGPCNKKRQPHDLGVKMGVFLDPKLEAYQLCVTAQSLYDDEKAARIDFLAAGGKLPTK